jgi:hypothetical protein
VVASWKWIVDIASSLPGELILYDHDERTAHIANSARRVGKGSQLIVVLTGTALASGGGGEDQPAG